MKITATLVAGVLLMFAAGVLVGLPLFMMWAFDMIAFKSAALILGSSMAVFGAFLAVGSYKYITEGEGNE